MNIFYHEYAEGFYSKFLNFTSFLSLIFSSAAFATVWNTGMNIFQSTGFSFIRDIFIAVFALFVTCLNGATLAFGMRTRFITHSNLKKKWIELLKSAELIGESDSVGFKSVITNFHNLNAEEPPPVKMWLDKAYKKAAISLDLKALIPQKT